MRYTTKHKLWGRAQLVVAIRSIVQQLDAANKALDNGKIVEGRLRLAAAIDNVHKAAQGMDIYKLDRKRIKVGLARVQKDLTALMELAKAIPVTQEEKALAQREKRETTIPKSKPGDDWKTIKPLGPLKDTRRKRKKKVKRG